MLKKSEVIYGRTVIIHEIAKKEYFRLTPEEGYDDRPYQFYGELEKNT